MVYAAQLLAGFCSHFRSLFQRWIQEGFKGFSAEAPKPDSGAFSGRFGSDFGGLPGCNSDFWLVTPTFGL